MKVGFDISQIAHNGGVATYTKNLAFELSKISDLDMVFFYSSLRKPYEGFLKNVRSFSIPPTFLEILFNELRVSNIEKFIGDIEIYHSSDWLQPKAKAKKVTTYHDIIPIKYPQWSHPKVVAVHKKRLELVTREIDKVIAVSNSTKRDLLEITKIPEEKIEVIHEAAGENFKVLSEDKIEKFRKKMKLPERFVLAISGVGNRRNLEAVKKASKDYDLVISGETIGWLSDEELPYLYNAAEVLLYPSFYEGFGLPVLEAMACGTPVITSNVSSLPEVGGDAPLYINPADQAGIDSSLKRVMESSSLRDEMKKKGIMQSKKFSWKKAANQTFNIYRKMILEE